jgi:NAD(P)-dependent dehydrogenase (short-subunit alcohol dehydrogenase family)/uncharacterized OB-fold protein
MSGKRNPLRRTRLPAPLSPVRSRTAHGLTAAAAEGRFQLQRCGDCGQVCYPPRDACPHCLSADLAFHDMPPGGRVIAETTIRIPGEVHVRERAPWRIGSVRLDCGPMAVAHLHGAVRQGDAVRMALLLDRFGAPALAALPLNHATLEDRQMQDFTCNPTSRRVLVTDARTPVGQAMVRALHEAGAALVFAGVADPWKPFEGHAALRAQAEIVPLDVTDSRSVAELAATLGARVDILVNTAEHTRPGGVLHAPLTEARQAMETRALGLMRLAQGFGPILRARGADEAGAACAFVSLFSAHALMPWPDYGAHAAAEAAALSLSRSLRAELAPGGIRVLHVFAGPTETEWYQTVPPPKLAPSAIARATVAALRGGGEDVYVGDIAEDLRARLAANPKALERELGQS